MKLYLTVVMLLFSLSVFSENQVAKIIALKGRAFIKSPDSGFRKLKLNQKLYNGDTVKTSYNSKVKLIFVDNSIVSVAPKSTFKIEKYDYDQKKKERNSVLNLLSGKVKLLVAKLSKKRNFKVKTSTATVGVRGTEFIVSSLNINESEILVLSGSVEVSNPLDDTGQIVILNKNDIIKTIGSLPVITPSKASKEDIGRLTSGLNIRTAIEFKVNFKKLFKRIKLKKLLKKHKLRIRRIKRLKNGKKMKLKRAKKRLNNFFKKGYLPPRRIKVRFKGEIKGGRK